MEALKKRIHDDSNGLDYVLVGDYYIPDLKLREKSRPIGRWGRMHREYLQEHRPGQYASLLLSGKLWTYLADLNEQANYYERPRLPLLQSVPWTGLLRYLWEIHAGAV